MAERWKWNAFVVYGFWVSMIIYPLFGAWTWGGGWLAQMGTKWNLGHGYVDFAGSGVVHAIGGFTALGGSMVIGPRIGKFNKDGTANTMPGHNLTMAMLGCFILAFGWFGFNPGSTLAGDRSAHRRRRREHHAGIGDRGGVRHVVGAEPQAVQEARPGHGGERHARRARRDHGTVGLRGPVGGAAHRRGCRACSSSSRCCSSRSAGVDDPVGAISVHGTCGLWGLISLGLLRRRHLRRRLERRERNGQGPLLRRSAASWSPRSSAAS